MSPLYNLERGVRSPSPGCLTPSGFPKIFTSSRKVFILAMCNGISTILSPHLRLDLDLVEGCTPAW